MTNPQARILIIDDDEDDFLITSEFIRGIPGANFTIDWCYIYEDAIRKIINKEYDLYFTDYRLGARSGVDLLQDIQQHGCEEPIILLTGKGNRDVDMQAMQLGAVDYLIKTELTAEKMERSLRYALERAASLRALKANEKKYRTIFQKTQDLVFIADEMLDFKDVNEASLGLLGYTKQALMQMNLCDLIEGAQHKKYLINALHIRKDINDWEVNFITANGERKICMLSASLDDSTESPGYVQGIIHDITARKREEKITLQSEKLAATGRLVRTLAHEVRNPLNNIMLSVEQLTEECQTESSDLYLNIIQRNSRRISDLISELLNTARPTEIVLAPHNLQVIMDDVISMAVDRITLKKIKLSLVFPPDPVPINADAEKLKIALLNILINAIEAIEQQAEGKISLTMHIIGTNAILNIVDNGCGISEENITRLFEPYFTQKRNGMGLGLAFTLNILQAHKAAIDVASSEKSGTTFSITFPLADADERTEPELMTMHTKEI